MKGQFGIVNKWSFGFISCLSFFLSFFKSTKYRLNEYLMFFLIFVFSFFSYTTE